MIDTQQEKDRQLFDRIASQYSKKDQITSCSEARRNQLETGMRPILGKKIPMLLEIGCGIGAAAEYLEGAYDAYIGVDYSVEQIKQAELVHAGRTGVSFVVKNVKDLNKNDVPPVDVVLAVGAFHHFTELDSALTAITTTMKHNGWLVAIEPQRENPIVQFLRFIRTKVDTNYSSNQLYFTAPELKEFLERNGFTDVELQYEGFFSPPFAQVPLYPQWIFVPLSRLSIALDRLCDRFLPKPFKRLSWNIIARGRFTGKHIVN